MIDFGLVSLFAIQLVLLALAFHSWRGIRGEISTLNVLHEALSNSEKTIEAINSRMDALDDVPKTIQKRVSTIESEIARLESGIERNATNYTSLNARLSVMNRTVKQKSKEMALASEDDDNEEELQSPGAQNELVIPRSFGKIRKVG